MKKIAFVLLLGLAGVRGAVSQQQEDPVIDGYVTRMASNSDFDVNGFRVFCDGIEYLSRGSVQSSKKLAAVCLADPLFVGEAVAVYGVEDTPANSVYATRVEIRPPQRGVVSGSAVIEAIPVQGTPGGVAPELLVRADGYRIRITSKTKVEYIQPLHTLADVRAGDWINYKGKVDAAGILIAESVHIGPNAIGGEEEKLRAKSEYDPSSVSADARQNLVRDAFALGYDPKKFPPFDDAAMQTRIEKIGNGLVPSYQLALPDSDPAKIQFRFQLVDNKHFCGLMPCDAFTLASGVILVPHQAVERMQNDSQLAAVLADAIARALERQQYRTEGKVKIAYATGLAATFVPDGGSFGMMAGEGVANGLLTKEMEQSGRVSLGLLHDAGYDIDQAPVAWWLLSSKKLQPINSIPMPERAAYLYRILGEVWHNPAVDSLKP